MVTINKGYRAFNGHVFTAPEARSYNKACELSETVAQLRGVGSDEHERALDNQHKAFVGIIYS